MKCFRIFLSHLVKDKLTTHVFIKIKISGELQQRSIETRPTSPNITIQILRLKLTGFLLASTIKPSLNLSFLIIKKEMKLWMIICYNAVLFCLKKKKKCCSKNLSYQTNCLIRYVSHNLTTVEDVTRIIYVSTCIKPNPHSGLAKPNNISNK